MKKTWHDDAFFGLHFDIHPVMEDTNLGENLTVEHLVEQFKKIKPDFVQCDCKGHPGVVAYPTKVGVASPGMKQDALKIWREATKQMGLPLIMHFSGVWDAAAVEHHPEYARIAPPGEEEWAVQGTCPLSDYTKDYMIPQMLEVIREYDVDGFWVDGENWASRPCYCERCKSAFEQETGLPAPTDANSPHQREWLDFHRKNFERHVALYADAVHREKPGCTVCSNWMFTVQEPDTPNVEVDYLSGDYAWIWGYYTAMMQARFMDGQPKKWDLMQWGFTNYEVKDNRIIDTWEFKPSAAMCQEAACVLACGGALTLYDTPNRRGNLITWHMDDVAELAEFCRARKPYCFETTSFPQAVVLHSSEHFYRNCGQLFDMEGAQSAMEGAMHLLLDSGYHTDIRNEDSLFAHLKEYPLCFVAEQEGLTEEQVSKLKQYVKEGGTLVISGKTTELFADILGVKLNTSRDLHEDDRDLYLRFGKRATAALGEWYKAVPTDSQKVYGLYRSRDMDEYKQPLQSVSATVTPYGKGTVAGIYGSLASMYVKTHYQGARAFFKQLLADCQITGLVKTQMPSYVHLSVREKGNALYLNLVNLSSANPTSPMVPMVEEVQSVGPVTLSLAMEKEPRRVLLMPGARPVKWEYDNGTVTITVDRVDIHDIVEIIRNEM